MRRKKSSSKAIPARRMRPRRNTISGKVTTRSKSPLKPKQTPKVEDTAYEDVSMCSVFTESSTLTARKSGMQRSLKPQRDSSLLFSTLNQTVPESARRLPRKTPQRTIFDSSDEEESRRRLFWEVYLLDRYATVSTAFDFALHDNDIDRKLPIPQPRFKLKGVEPRGFRKNE